MANNKYAGFNPKYKDGVEATAQLDKSNPYEFRMGMDYELTNLGCSRLAESTPEEREKATETVLKNLNEYGGYYSKLIQYESEFGRNYAGSNSSKPPFKTWLKEFTEEYEMKEVKNGLERKNVKQPEFSYKHTQLSKTDKMGEQKPNDLNTIKLQTLQPLKEAIKKEISQILTEADNDKNHKSAEKGAKGKKGIAKKMDKLEDEKKQKESKRSEFFQTYKNSKKDANAVKKYKEKAQPLQDRIKEIDKELKDLENDLLGIKEEEKGLRREAASTMMDKKVHLEILNIIKEKGISLREGAEGVRIYYDIAKLAYIEVVTAGMRNNI